MTGSSLVQGLLSLVIPENCALVVIYQLFGRVLLN